MMILIMCECMLSWMIDCWECVLIVLVVGVG